MPALNNGGFRQQGFNHHQSSWFLGAPVTKLLCMLWAAGSFWVINSNEEDFQSSRDYGDSNTSIWGSVVFNGSSNWVFQSPTEVIVGLSFLAHYLRRLEQELSSRRLIAWLVFLEVAYVFVRIVAIATLDDELSGVVLGASSSSASAKGPYLVAGGLLYWYKAFVPRLYPRFMTSTTLGIACSEKTFPYLWGAYVVYMRGTASLLVCTIGGLVSALHFFLLFASTNGRSGTSSLFLDVPDAIVNLLPWESIGSFFFVDPSPKIYAPFMTMRALMNMNMRNGGGGGRPRRQRAVPAVAQPQRQQQQQRVAEPPIAVAEVAPSPEAVAQLTSMGFEEARVKEALQASNNNLEQAANILLMTS